MIISSPKPQSAREGAGHYAGTHKTTKCEFCDVAGTVYGADMKKYIATTDINDITDYWSDDVITVGFKNNSLSNVNVFNEFQAQNNPTPCTPGSPWTTLCGQLFLNSDGTYDIYSYLDNNYSSTDFLIHVLAKFLDGKSIDECQTVTIGSSVNIIQSEIRGNIKNYNSGIINYQVDVYLQ